MFYIIIIIITAVLPHQYFDGIGTLINTLTKTTPNIAFKPHRNKLYSTTTWFSIST